MAILSPLFNGIPVPNCLSGLPEPRNQEERAAALALAEARSLPARTYLAEVKRRTFGSSLEVACFGLYIEHHLLHKDLGHDSLDAFLRRHWRLPELGNKQGRKYRAVARELPESWAQAIGQIEPLFVIAQAPEEVRGVLFELAQEGCRKNALEAGAVAAEAALGEGTDVAAVRTLVKAIVLGWKMKRPSLVAVLARLLPELGKVVAGLKKTGMGPETRHLVQVAIELLQALLDGVGEPGVERRGTPRDAGGKEPGEVLPAAAPRKARPKEQPGPRAEIPPPPEPAAEMPPPLPEPTVEMPPPDAEPPKEGEEAPWCMPLVRATLRHLADPEQQVLTDHLLGVLCGGPAADLVHFVEAHHDALDQAAKDVLPDWRDQLLGPDDVVRWNLAFVFLTLGQPKGHGRALHQLRSYPLPDDARGYVLDFCRVRPPLPEVPAPPTPPACSDLGKEALDLQHSIDQLLPLWRELKERCQGGEAMDCFVQRNLFNEAVDLDRALDALFDLQRTRGGRID